MLNDRWPITIVSLTLAPSSTQVDYVVCTADQTLEKGKSGVAMGVNSVKHLHSANMKTFSSALETYFSVSPSPKLGFPVHADLALHALQCMQSLHACMHHARMHTCVIGLSSV